MSILTWLIAAVLGAFITRVIYMTSDTSKGWGAALAIRLAKGADVLAQADGEFYAEVLAVIEDEGVNEGLSLAFSTFGVAAVQAGARAPATAKARATSSVDSSRKNMVEVLERMVMLQRTVIPKVSAGLVGVVVAVVVAVVANVGEAVDNVGQLIAILAEAMSEVTAQLAVAIATAVALIAAIFKRLR